MRRRWILFSAYFLTYVVFAGLITWTVMYVTGPDFLLHEVIITGHEDSISDLQIFRQQNLLFLDTRLLKQQLMTETLIKSADIRKIFPDKLSITIDERTPVVRLRSSDQTYLLDTEGVILPLLPRFAKLQLPEIGCQLLTVINGQGKDIPALKPLLAIISEINRQPQLQIVSLTCINATYYSAVLDNGTEILLDVGKDPTQTIASLLFLVKQFRIEGKWPQLLDLRFDKPVLQEKKIVQPHGATKSAQ